MSLGNCGLCRKASEDDEVALYEYCSYKLSFDDARKEIFDGLILIKKTSLLKPQRREKIRRMPRGRRRKFTKIIMREVDIGALIASGDVQIENCSQAWRILPIGIDYVSVCLCRKIFLDYQRAGTLPERCGWFV